MPQVKGILDAVKTQFHAMRDIAKKQDVRAMLFEDLDPESPTYGAMCLGSMGFEIASKRTADGKDWIWSTCFIYYKHTAGGVVKNKEYFLENVTNLGLPLPLMKPDFPILTSPMFMVTGDWSTPTAAIAALQLKADGTLSWVSSHGHTEPLTYMGFIAYIAK